MTMKGLILRVAFLLFALLWVAHANAAARFGVCTTTCTWDNASTAMWSATSGGATGASAPSSADDVTFDVATCVGGTTCTITVNANLAVASITAGACTASTTGCILDFSVNNNNVSASLISFSGAGTRNIKCGSGTFTISSTSGNVFDNNTTTGETLTCSSATFTFTATTASRRTFLGGGKSYGPFIVSANASLGSIGIFGSNTFSSWSLSAGASLRITAGSTQTVTTAPTIVGTSSAPILITSDDVSVVTISIASGTFNCAWCGFWNVTGSGGATFTATNSQNYGNNSGITITGPTAGGGSAPCIKC